MHQKKIDALIISELMGSSRNKVSRQKGFSLGAPSTPLKIWSYYFPPGNFNIFCGCSMDIFWNSTMVKMQFASKRDILMLYRTFFSSPWRNAQCAKRIHLKYTCCLYQMQSSTIRYEILYIRCFINVFSGGGGGGVTFLHKWAKLLELNFFVRKMFL